MPSTSINGCAIYYEVFGAGPPVVITGGARESLDMTRPVAEQLSKSYRVILWDRATVGRSDVQFAGARDLELWATQLAELLRRLDCTPAYLVAPSNGARISMVTALRYPEVVKGMLLFLITGGGEKGLGQLFADTAAAVESGGMRAVMAIDYWAERMAANPANRGLLSSMPAAAAVCTMHRWAAAFDPTFPITGMSKDDLARIKVRTRVLDATEPTNDFKRANKQLASLLPNAEVIYDEEFQQQWSELYRKLGKYQGHYTEPASLVRLIDQFVTDFEASRNA